MTDRGIARSTVGSKLRCTSLRPKIQRRGRLGVAIVVALAVAVTISYYMRALSRLGAEASRNSALSYADREISGGNSIVIDQEAVYEARALIPPEGTYRVLTGSRLREATPLTASFVNGWYLSFLMPRRQMLTARWVVCYGCDRFRAELTFEDRWHDDHGISIGQLR
jgi:hypothetical protein